MAQHYFVQAISCACIMGLWMASGHRIHTNWPIQEGTHRNAWEAWAIELFSPPECLAFREFRHRQKCYLCYHDVNLIGKFEAITKFVKWHHFEHSPPSVVLASIVNLCMYITTVILYIKPSLSSFQTFIDFRVLLNNMCSNCTFVTYMTLSNHLYLI